jgi:hypothetical protein
VKYLNRFRVHPGDKVRLKDIDPGFKDHHESHKKAAEEIERDREKLRALQALLYADGRCSLLICLQGLDAGGKDGTISHILGAMNPQGCRVTGFKQPSAEEQAHDFLWRIHRRDATDVGRMPGPRRSVPRLGNAEPKKSAVGANAAAGSTVVPSLLEAQERCPAPSRPSPLWDPTMTAGSRRSCGLDAFDRRRPSSVL